jgi:hemoglobin/transferrin/lactoferrin receptor protein
VIFVLLAAQETPMRKYLPFLFFLSVQALFAQKAQVFNISTLRPIEDVFVVSTNNTQSELSDQNGRFSLDSFKLSDTLILQHPSFQSKVITLASVVAQNRTVYLQEKAIDLGVFVVRANKRIAKREDIPNKVNAIGRKEIEFQNPQTSADLLAQSAEVFVQKSQLGGGSPMIRGFAANKVLIVVDGIRMNNAIFRGGNLQNVINLDPLILDKTEVIFGPGSVIYGSDALGGVMNFSTRKPRSFKDSSGFKIGSTMRYSSANNERTIKAYLETGRGAWSSLTVASASLYDDLKAGRNRSASQGDFGKRTWYVDRLNNRDSIVANDKDHIQRFSGYNQFNLSQKISFRPSDSVSWHYSLLYSTTSDIPRYDRLIETRNGLPRNSEWYYGPQQWLMNHLNVEIRKKAFLFDRLDAHLAHQFFLESRHDRRFRSDELRSRTERVNLLTLNLDLDKNINEKNELFYGFEFNRNVVESEAEQTNILSGASRAVASRYPEGGSSTRQLAAYLSHQYKQNEQSTILWGVRYTRNHLYSDFRESTFYDFPFQELTIQSDAVTASLGYTYRPWSSWQFNLSLSSGFRSPNVDDVSKVFDSEPGRVVVPNDDLLPEYAYNAELGALRQLGDRGQVQLNVFYTYLQNAIVREVADFNGLDSIVYDGVLSEVLRWENTGQAFVAGVSYSLMFNLTDNFGLKSSMTYMQGEDLENQETLRHVSPLFGSTGLAFVTEKVRSELYANYNGAIPFDRLAPSEKSKTHLYGPNGSAAWYTLNWKFTFRPSVTVALSAGVENILDLHYRPYSSGISAAGRNLFISFRADI